MKVLLVAVYPAVRAVLRQVLAGLVEELLECAESGAALELYAAQRPACVLLDGMLPGKTALELTRRLTKTDPAARILWLADTDDAALRQAARAAGATGFVLKENLLAVREWLTASATEEHVS